MKARTPAAPGGTPATGTEQEPAWRRLSPRMLAVHPLHEALRFLPVILGVFFLGRDGEKPWGLIGLALALVVGLGRYFTTTYRVTAYHVQVRRGLLRREVLSVPLDRIRSVDVSARVLQRVLGLRRLAIGTGRADRHGDGLVLDALDIAAAEQLRNELLHRTGQPAQADAPQAGAIPDAGAGVPRPHPAKAGRPRRPRAGKLRSSVREQGHKESVDENRGKDRWDVGPAGEELITALRPTWVRFGAFTLSGLAGVGVLLTSAVTFLNSAELGPDRFPPVRALLQQISSVPTPLAVLESVVLGLLVVALLSALGYAASFWNFRLTRLSNGTLRLTRGLVTTRSVTIEKRRLRGIEISETLPLRLVRGARCSAITTGLRAGRGAEPGGSLLLPPAPLTRAREVAAAVYGDAAPMDCPLTRHGTGAKRRRLTRARGAAVVAIALTGALSLWAEWPTWSCPASLALLPLAELMGRDRYRNLGHALLEGGHLVTSQGSLVRRRQILSGDAAVGWIFHQSFFQRRSGVTTLTMATAAGRQYYNVLDLPTKEATALAADARPDWLEPFLVNETGAQDDAGTDTPPTA
ncbi:PH domain-containing protein [Streptomyces sp. N2A]|uniref:PH domain-containing protein n=1 Tax=Streptomyces sp. N2A TaxID=3073936 RepID=UPI00286FF90B|nr:PH domain-containing protein [Streptomyces sp. N2A]